MTRLLEAVNPAALSPDAADIVRRLSGAEREKLEIAADHLLAGVYTGVDVGEAPLIGAALQVYWVKMALQLPISANRSLAQSRLCPVCGSHPVASVVRIGGAQQGLRYLLCSLCGCEWHMVRVKCSACASTKGLAYLSIERGSEAIKAECCDQCKSYLKIFYLEKDTTLVPAVDDLASLPLDVLVDAEGYNRIGPNLLFAPGQ
jgi:FdhE protein